MMDKVAFVNVRADQEGLCGATVNTGSESQLCIREGCAVHKVEVGRAERELSPNHMYLLAPVSNNKLAVISYPRLSLEGLEEPTKVYLPGRAPVECEEDRVIILNLLNLERTEEGRLWDILYLETLWWRYFKGQSTDDTLTSLGLSSPRMKATSSGIGTKAFDFSTATMSNQEPDKEDEKMCKVKGSKRKSVKTEPGFGAETVESHEQTRAFSDKRKDDAALEYEPQQMMCVLQRLKDLSDNLSLIHTHLPIMEALMVETSIPFVRRWRSWKFSLGIQGLTRR